MAPNAPITIAFAIASPLERSDLPGLLERVCALLEQTSPQVAFCDVSGARADAVTIDALARLQLGARRRGCQVRLRNAPGDLRALVALMGLQDVLVE
jgi:ABC-type transporter Mla MlaB component